MPLLHKIAGFVVVCAVALGLTLPRDRPEEAAEPVAAPPKAPLANADPVKAAPGPGEPTPAPTRTVKPGAKVGRATAAAARVKANELGQIPVLMYHRIVDKPQLPLDRTGKEFREELVRLAKAGYVPITAGQMVGGRFNVPAGRHPVVLTFDDSSPSQFSLDAQGRPQAGTAVAIMREVQRQYPWFRATATFYITEDLFRMEERAAAGLKWLVRNGFELGNHTLTHKDLSTLSEEGVQKEIGTIEEKIVGLSGRHTRTLAYPFGSEPDKPSWAHSKEGVYAFQGIFLAGWKPSESPFHDDFERFAIPRVRSEGKIKENDCDQYCSTAWLERLDKNPQERYTSDGDPNTISFPRMNESLLAPEFRARGRVY